MYTQCPHCHTIFALTEEQLVAREGRVRCGRCQQVFQGDDYMFDTLPEEIGTRTAESENSAPVGERYTPRPLNPDDSRIPTVDDLSWMEAQIKRRLHRRWWAFGSFVLLLVLAAQAAYAYRLELAREPQARAWMERLCAPLQCTVPTPHDVNQIELDAEVTPHPQYERALNVNAVLINRATYPQPFPLMELSFTDAQGVTIARRAFPPADYLGDAADAARGMAPNVEFHVQMEVTQPARDAIGYEVQLVDPR